MKARSCCDITASRDIEQIVVDGRKLGIICLEDVLNGVLVMDLQTEDEIEEALLKRVKIFNYVPPNSQHVYGRALMSEYRRRYNYED